MRATLLALALAVAGANAAGSGDATAGASARTALLLADGRQSLEAGNHPQLASQPALRAASRSADAFWRTRNPAYERDYRVVSVVRGAFTEALANQQAVLYLLSRWPRGRPNMGLAIVGADGRLLHSYAFDVSTQQLSATPDVDGDGLDELMLMGSFGMGGDYQAHFLLLSLREGRPQQLAEGVLATDSCASGRPGSGSEAYRVTLAPDRTLWREQFTRACDEAATWVVGPRQPHALGEPVDWRYTDLSPNR